MLTTRIKLEIAGALVAIVLVAIAVGSWLGAREDAIKLKATLDAQQSVIAEAGKREADRDAALKVSLASLEASKKATQTPTQAISALPGVIPLPRPIYLNAPPPAVQQSGSGKPSAPVPQTATIPAEDLKPLYDFGVDCQECKKQLAVAVANKADDKVKLDALTKERDAAVTAAKGGSKWSRIKRAGKWLIIGAAAGAVAVKIASH